MLGRPDLAAAGQLGIVAGGPEDAVRTCEPLLSVMGRKTFPAGVKPESATAIKLANNAVLGCAMVAMAEGFSLVRKYGVLPQVFQDVMTEGLFSATAYKVYGQKMVDESYDQVGIAHFRRAEGREPDRSRGRSGAGPDAEPQRLLRAPPRRRRARRRRPRSGCSRAGTGARLGPRVGDRIH